MKPYNPISVFEGVEAEGSAGVGLTYAMEEDVEPSVLTNTTALALASTLSATAGPSRLTRHVCPRVHEPRGPLRGDASVQHEYKERSKYIYINKGRKALVVIMRKRSGDRPT